MSDAGPRHCSPVADLPPGPLLEVFLRLPPEPHHLLAASLVCKRWRRLVRNPSFLRSFRAFHRAPPVLGFFQNLWRFARGPRTVLDRRRLGFTPMAPSIRMLTPPDPDLMRCAVDCRHGRVLLRGPGDQGLHVWDPMTGEARSLSMPPVSQGLGDIDAALVCAAGHDDHPDCHSAPFQIVFLDAHRRDEDEDDVAMIVSAYVYSSETDAWGDATVITSPSSVGSGAKAVVGTSVYWSLYLVDETSSSYILEFSLPAQRMELIELPGDANQTYNSGIHVMLAEDGNIGFAGVNQSSVHLWSRRTEPEGAARWVLIRTIDLNKCTLSGLPAGDVLMGSYVVASLEDRDELYLRSVAGIFMVHISSLQLTKVPEATGSLMYPYTSFYTRGRDIAGIDDTDNL